MTMPYYASAEQIMRDRSELARKGIARGRSVVVLTYADGVLFVAENPSTTLHKVSEIYDRIGFAAVGKYNEFENLRRAGIQHADLRGYSYDRRDVTGRSLANAYAQTLGTIFTEQPKPYEVEICVAEVGRPEAAKNGVGRPEAAKNGEGRPEAAKNGEGRAEAARNGTPEAATNGTPEAGEPVAQLYRITYDGSIVDEPQFVVMGGATEPIASTLKEKYQPGLALKEAIGVAVSALQQDGTAGARTVQVGSLEVATLEQARPRRAFRRLPAPLVASLLPAAGSGGPAAAGADAQ